MLKVVVETDVELYDKLMMYEFNSKNRNNYWFIYELKVNTIKESIK